MHTRKMILERVHELEAGFAAAFSHAHAVDYARLSVVSVPVLSKTIIDTRPSFSRETPDSNVMRASGCRHS